MRVGVGGQSVVTYAVLGNDLLFPFKVIYESNIAERGAGKLGRQVAGPQTNLSRQLTLCRKQSPCGFYRSDLTVRHTHHHSAGLDCESHPDKLTGTNAKKWKWACRSFPGLPTIRQPLTRPRNESHFLNY